MRVVSVTVGIAVLFMSLSFASYDSWQNEFSQSLETKDPLIANLFLQIEDSLYLSKVPKKTSDESVSIEKGKEIFHQGYAIKDNGGQSRRVSPFFTCTSCHNYKREDPILHDSNPDKRLDYVIERNMPFLPGTTMYGAIDRETFYNDDYVKKYGELVYAAKHDIRNAIQLCATECSQGRVLEEWEMESLLAYYWSIGIRLSDLDIEQSRKNKIKTVYEESNLTESMLSDLKQHYAVKSPATFIDPPKDRRLGNAYDGDISNGKKIYEHSCLHCHKDSRFAFFELDSISQDVRFLKNHLFQYDRYSAYQVVRYGTSPIPGKRSYMPLYPKEKMSLQQMADLREFLIQCYDNSNR